MEPLPHRLSSGRNADERPFMATPPTPTPVFDFHPAPLIGSPQGVSTTSSFPADKDRVPAATLSVANRLPEVHNPSAETVDKMKQHLALVLSEVMPALPFDRFNPLLDCLLAAREREELIDVLTPFSNSANPVQFLISKVAFVLDLHADVEAKYVVHMSPIRCNY